METPQQIRADNTAKESCFIYTLFSMIFTNDQEQLEKRCLTYEQVRFGPLGLHLLNVFTFLDNKPAYALLNVKKYIDQDGGE